MPETSDRSDLVKKKLMPDDLEFLAEWTKYNSRAITELAAHFCRFPGDVEISLALKMRPTGGGEFTFTFGEITASRMAIDKAFAEHEAQKRAKETLQ